MVTLLKSFLEITIGLFPGECCVLDFMVNVLHGLLLLCLLLVGFVNTFLFSLLNNDVGHVMASSSNSIIV